MKKTLGKMDLVLLIITILLCIFGCVMIFSASSIAAVLRYHVSSNHFFFRQLLFVVGSFLLGFLVILRVPTSRYKIFAPFLLVGILASLFGLFIYGIVSNGAKSWYDVGFFKIQPSEFAKSILIIAMACFYDFYSKSKKSNPISSIIPLIIGFMIAFVVFLQPDLGGAIIIGVIALGIFLSVPIGKKIKRITLVSLTGLAIIGGLLVFTCGDKILSEHQLSRLEFRNPCERYLENTGYQVCNGFIALHNGGFLGVGLGKSTQKYLYLPEAHTDFIYPIIVEELGIVAGVLVLIGYIILLFRILKIAREASNLRNSILTYGTFLMILLHVSVNLLGVLAVVPLTGVPLPLLSYGGSFTANVIVMIFVCERVAIENKNAKNNKELAKL